MKRIVSILLAALLLASCGIISVAAAEEEAVPSYSWFDAPAKTVAEAVAEYEAENGALTKNRYYFLMPNGSNGQKGSDGSYAPVWYNEFSETACIYWWDSGVADPAAWVGYIPEKCSNNVTEKDIYYADVPVDITGVVWNNGVNGGMDDKQPIYFKAAQTNNIGTEYYDAGESDNYPDGTENFNNMIYVVDPDIIDVNELSQKQTCGGEWYYYYGNGCYGFTKDGKPCVDCLRDDHYENGVHKTCLGDADGNNQLDLEDVTAIQMYLAEGRDLTAEGIALADVDSDGEATILDAVLIQKAIAGIIEL